MCIVLCQYCKGPARLTDGAEIYPHRPDLKDKNFYICDKDQAWVGTHPGTIKPLGRLADKELRKWKSKTHAAFDPIWKQKRMKRKDAYAWLAKELGINVDDCHVGMFDIDLCKRAITVCDVYRQTGGNL